MEGESETMAATTDRSIDMKTIDVKKIAAFAKKHSVLLILLAVLLIQFVPNGDGQYPWGGIWMRMEAQDLPFTDQWASATVENNIKAQIRQGIDQEYPHVTSERKNALVNEEFDKAFAGNPELAAQKAAVSAQFKEFYQYEADGEVFSYMPDIDPYTYLRRAENIIDHGFIGDEKRNNTMWNTHMLAPLGRPEAFSLHPYVIAGLFTVASWFSSLDLMQSAALFPVVFIFLSLIPAFFIGRRVAGDVGGIFTATIIAISASVMSRTVWGRADTDAYNIFFPLLIVWLLFESFSHKEIKKKILFAGLAGLAVGLYSFAWAGWWYLFDAIIIGIITHILFVIITHYKEWRRTLKTVEMKRFFWSALSFVLVSAVTVSIFAGGIKNFLNAALGPLKFTTIKNAAHGSLWPNVYTTVAELNTGSFDLAVAAMGGAFLFILAILGIVGILITARDERGKIDIRYSILLVVWFVVAIYATTKGSRFTLILAPAFAVALGAFFGIATTYLAKWLWGGLRIPKWVSTMALVVLFAALLSWPSIGVPQKAFLYAQNDVPIMNDAWWNTLTTIKETSAPDAIISSWWDFGHHFKFVADRAVIFDGASQNTPMAHWIGRSLLTSSEEESVGILRMLSCGSNSAFESLVPQMAGAPEATALLKKVIQEDKTEARNSLSNAGITNVDEVLSFTHCSPPEHFLITSSDMVGKSGVWGHFGAWNFERSHLWVNLKDGPRDLAVNDMIDRFSWTREDAEKAFDAVQTMDSTQGNAWIAPWPSYHSGLAPCTTRNDSIVCNNGVTLVNETALLQTPQGVGRLDFLVGISPETGMVQEDYFQSESIGLAAAIIPNDSGSSIQSIIAHPSIARSMFTKLFFFKGAGLQHFELVSTERQLDGGLIYVWKVKWPPDTSTVTSPSILSSSEELE